MSIQWFPGHMTRARRLIEEELRLIDVVVEIVDARIPESSRNPLLQDILGKRRPRLLVLNKEDLADPGRTKYWLDNYEANGQKALAVNARWSGKKMKSVLNQAISELGAEKREKYIKKGAKKADIRAMIVGVPNVGKSTVINTLVGRASATTGNKPGVTKGKQWIRLSQDVELLDTPGLLWPKIEDESIGYRLALTGAVSDDVFSAEEAAYRLIGFMMAHYPNLLIDRYQLEVLADDAYEIMLDIGRKRGVLVRGGKVDVLKSAQLIIKDFRSGKLGRITLE